MTAEQFTYWLQGFMEMANPTTLNETQTQIIKDHLKLVFDKHTPDRSINIRNDLKPWPNPNQTPPYISSPYPDWINKPNVYCDINDKKIC